MLELFYIHGAKGQKGFKGYKTVQLPCDSLPAKAVLPLSKEGEFILASRLCVALNFDVYLLFGDKM